MKPTLFIPPVVALAIAAGWVGHQKQSLVRVNAENAALEKRISAAKADPSSTGGAEDKKSKQAGKDKDRIDWKKAAEDFAVMQSDRGYGDFRGMIRMQAKLQSMSRDELVAALDEIASLDMSDDARKLAEQAVLGPLAEKDPKVALERFGKYITAGESGAFSWQLGGALGKWAKDDPSAAAAWMDQRIAAGVFESKALNGKSALRTQFEGSLLQAMVSSGNMDAASARLQTLPPGERADALQYGVQGPVKDENQLSYAQLVRNQIPAEQQSEAIARPVSTLSKTGGYAKVDEYLDRISATAAEREACVEEAMRDKFYTRQSGDKVSREEIDDLRAWTTKQAPAQVNEFTGQALAQAGSGRDPAAFADAAKIAAEYHQAGGDDRIITAFLENGSARHHKEAAVELAAKITDPKLREQFQHRFKP